MVVDVHGFIETQAALKTCLRTARGNADSKQK
jgi:hypothetical protein